MKRLTCGLVGVLVALSSVTASWAKPQSDNLYINFVEECLNKNSSLEHLSGPLLRYVKSLRNANGS